MDSIIGNRIVLGIAAMALLLTPVAVYAASFLDIRLADVKTSATKVDAAHLVTKAKIPKDGSAGAFGYGIITGDSVIVSTTHKGVLDSSAQKDKEGPVFHNHYVHIVADSQACGDGNYRVTAISHDSPGKVSVGGASISLKSLPKSSSDPPLTQDNNVKAVVSFKLVPTGNIVCVTNVHAADKVNLH